MKVDLVEADFETISLPIKNRLRIFWMILTTGKLRLDVTIVNPNVTFNKNSNWNVNT